MVKNCKMCRHYTVETFAGTCAVLSKMEQDISKKRLDFMKEVNEFYNINTVLQSVENVKII